MASTGKKGLFGDCWKCQFSGLKRGVLYGLGVVAGECRDGGGGGGICGDSRGARDV